jgi:ribonuclease T2
MRTITAVMLLFCLCAATDARSKKKSPKTPGKFDYYLLSLSWSPQYCSDAKRADRDPLQCGVGRRFAFVAHGLWPNNNRAPHPQDCAPHSKVSETLLKQMLEIMPSPALIQHEWDTHGTCSGVNQQDYFSLVRTAYRLVAIPQPYQQPAQDLRVSAVDVRRNFQKANPTFLADGIKLDCSGQFLREIRVCFDKNLVSRSCSTAIQDTCGSRTVTMLRVR